MTHLLHQLLSESAARWPDKEAVRFEGLGFTYSQLEAHVNQLARTLRDAGVRRGDRVGIYAHKSLAAVAGMFGAMKAGAIYVPLDPNAPAKRLAYITRNCEINVLVASGQVSGLADLLSEETPVQAVILTDEQQPADLPNQLRTISWAEVRQQDDKPVRPSGAIETDLAYILYTSGSTGEPKGVMISHRTILIFINWSCEAFHMTPDERVTSHAPLHFDLSTFDIYATLKAGGTVVLVPERLSVFPVQLADLLQHERITITYLVPSILSLMITYGKLDAHDLSVLRAVLFAGEVFPIKSLRQLATAIPHADLYNLYGPTETNVCTYYKVQPSDLSPDRAKPVPIGIACENTEVFAVDDRQHLVTEPGREGELWVRGSCVAQGYWGDADKTAANFVSNTFQPHFREVAYRTGDIVTLADDGVNWIYVGRRDHMVKSRGYRIELGEIEAALHSHQKVKEAAVITIPDDLIGNRIKAFVVPLPGDNLSRQDLEAHCSQVLPRYMLPESFEFREELPKTSTGKINRLLLAQALSGEG
ncbi:MAG: amino acid adenylation domain-containing protein [Bryobacteraceae bacterium]